MRVSVLMPVYNAERYLRPALDGILAQTFSDFECLAHDDGSLDNSLSILREYAAKDSRIIVSSAPNKGLVPVLNDLSAQACGDFLARADADDISEPERFASQVEHLTKYPRCVVVGCQQYNISDAGLPILPISFPTTHEAIEELHLVGLCKIPHSGAMIRRTALQAVGGYDHNMCHAEDFDLWLRLGEIGRVANLETMLLRYRVHDAAVSHLHANEQAASADRACRDARRRRGLHENSEYERPKRMGTGHSPLITYGWIAWGNGHKNTWANFAKRALLAEPFSLEAWRLAVVGAIKSPT